MSHTIKILDAIDCSCGPALADIIKPCLSFPAVYYQQSAFRKIRREYEKTVLTKGDGEYFFYTGLLPRVLSFCEERNVPIITEGEREVLPFKDPITKFTEFTLEEKQLRVVKKVIKEQRGMLKAPTGLGKTIMAMSIISAFLTEDNKVLWLCHTKDLMYQAGEVALKELKLKSGYYGDKHSDLTHRLTIGTRQSFINISEEVGWEFDVVIIDEAHHISSFDCQYTQILSHILAPSRIGLTATMPKDMEATLAIEGMLGPIIDEITMEEAKDMGRVSDVRIKFIKIPISYQVKELKKYSDVYDAGVVNREEGIKRIAAKAKEHADKNESVLIIVNRIPHGDNILEELENIGAEAFFANGSTESQVRLQLKEALNNKDTRIGITTTIWKEGVDIPSLDVIINAAGGKAEIATLQAIGRGLRQTETKKLLTLYDMLYLDHPYLISHLGERLAIYSEMGWL